jgi:coproporphyrinogen III oxidase
MNIPAVRSYLLNLQAQIVSSLETFDGESFRRDAWQRPEGGGGISRLIENGLFFERGGVNFSHVKGTTLPASATAHRP